MSTPRKLRTLGTSSNPTWQQSLAIASYRESLIEKGMTYLEANAKAEDEFLPSRERNARKRRAKFHSAVLGEQVPQASKYLAYIKRKQARTSLGADCSEVEAEYMPE